MESIHPGQQLGHYRIVSRLGGGGMGEVFRAEDLRLERPVAIKFLPPAMARDGEAVERFTREARAASSLHHPGIVSIYDFGTLVSGHDPALAAPEPPLTTSSRGAWRLSARSTARSVSGWVTPVVSSAVA